VLGSTAGKQYRIYNASADGAVPGLLSQVMRVRILPEAPVMPLWTNLVKSALSKGAVFSVRI
jgi:hypothetical protein